MIFCRFRVSADTDGPQLSSVIHVAVYRIEVSCVLLIVTMTILTSASQTIITSVTVASAKHFCYVKR